MVSRSDIKEKKTVSRSDTKEKNKSREAATIMNEQKSRAAAALIVIQAIVDLEPEEQDHSKA